MSWATNAIEKLKNGEEVEMRPRGNSMKGKMKEGTYIPDFFVGDEIWEVKGYWRKDAKPKFSEFKRKYKTLKVKVLEKKELINMGIKL